MMKRIWKYDIANIKYTHSLKIYICIHARNLEKDISDSYLSSISLINQIIAPPYKNSHAPPPTESGKRYIFSTGGFKMPISKN